MIVFRNFKHLQKKRLLSPGSVSMTFDLCPSGSAPLFVCSFICGSFCEVLGLGPEWRPCSTSCGFWQRFCQTDNSVFVLVFGIPSATWSETLGWTGSDCYRDLKGTVQVLKSVALTTRSLVQLWWSTSVFGLWLELQWRCGLVAVTCGAEGEGRMFAAVFYFLLCKHSSPQRARDKYMLIYTIFVYTLERTVLDVSTLTCLFLTTCWIVIF